MKLMNIGIILLLVFTLIGCQPEEYNKIPLIIYNIEDPYIKNFRDQILEDAEDLFEVISFDSKNSQIIQNEIIVEQLKKRPKAIIVNPVDRLGAYTIIEKAKEYAEYKGKSLSYLVEEFFQELVKEREASYNYAVSELDEIRSLVKGKIPKGLDYKEEIKKIKL